MATKKNSNEKTKAKTIGKRNGKSNGEAKKPAGKPRQQKIPGTERVAHPDVRDAAEEYVVARDERMQLTEREAEAKSALMAVMKNHKLDHYIDEEAEIEVSIVATEETVRVKRWKRPKDQQAEAAG